MKTRLMALVLLALLIIAPCGAEDSAVETLLSQLTLREKVGQLFWIRPEQLNRDDQDQRVSGGKTKVTDQMRLTSQLYPVGGFVLFGGNISGKNQLRQYVSDLSTLGRVRPALAVDEEGGSVRRLGKTEKLGLPTVKSMAAIGRTGSPANAYNAGYIIGEYLADYGFSMDLAPVADVITNKKNTVIGSRSFGSDPELVSLMVSNYITGLHEWGISSCIKHFPGHGGTSGDTHAGFVPLNRTWEELLESELVPFIDQIGLTDAIMAAHITVPKVTADGLPASLSRELITVRLRGTLGYDGLVMTDALEMGAITDNYTAGEAAILAFEAGNDILLMPGSLPEAFNAVLLAVETGRIPEQRLDESVRRILRWKLGAVE